MDENERQGVVGGERAGKTVLSCPQNRDLRYLMSLTEEEVAHLLGGEAREVAE